MFGQARERWRLRRQITAIEKQFSSRLVQEGEGARAEFEAKRTSLWRELQVLETRKLKRDLQRFGIVKKFDQDELRLEPYTGRFFLDENARTRARQLVIDARFNWWKRWIDVFSPIVSVIISILALVVSIVALYRT